METLTPMAFALCVALQVKCTYAANLFYDSFLSKDTRLQYERAITCDDPQETCELLKESGVCTAIARYQYPSAAGVIYFCRPDPEDGGAS